LTLAVLLLAAATAPPQVYFEQRTVVRENGDAGADVLSRVWYSGKRMRLEAGDAPGGPALLLRLDSGQAFRLDPERKIARQLDSLRLRARAQMDASVANDLMGTGEGNARTAALSAPGKTVAGYACRGYRISAPSLQMDVYVSDAIPLSVDIFADFLEWTGASQALGGLLSEIRRLPGFPMETRSRVSVMGRTQETISTVTKVQIAPQPAALFEIPAGYRIETDAVQED
jgi:hypothetical protein